MVMMLDFESRGLRSTRSRTAMNRCLNCEKETKNAKFCNHKCSAIVTNKTRSSRSVESKLKTSVSMKNLQREVRVKKLYVPPKKKCIVCEKVISKYNKWDYCREHWFSSLEGQQQLASYQKFHKQFVYNKWTDSNVYLLSSLEKRYFDYLELHNIKWEKPKPISYLKIGSDKSHLYYADFYLPDSNEFIEIKGYMWKGDKEKLDCVQAQHPNINLVILFKSDLDKLIIR